MARPATRLFVTKVHLLVAAFIFPAIVMFLVTGGLYTWGITGKYTDTEHMITLQQPLENDKAALDTMVKAELDRLDLSPPSGNARVRTVGDSFTYEWTGANRDVTLAPTANPNEAKLTVKDTGIHRYFVQLHKAKGSTLFKVYASILAIALFLLVLSGLIISLITPAFRRMTLWASGVGAVIFVGAVALG